MKFPADASFDSAQERENIAEKQKLAHANGANGCSSQAARVGWGPNIYGFYHMEVSINGGTLIISWIWYIYI